MHIDLTSTSNPILRKTASITPALNMAQLIYEFSLSEKYFLIKGSFSVNRS